MTTAYVNPMCLFTNYDEISTEEEIMNAREAQMYETGREEGFGNEPEYA